MGFLALFQPEHKKRQELKERLLKNKEGVLDAFAENIKGARQCPFLLGQKCIGGLCEHFQKYTAYDKSDNKIEYHRCVHNQTPALLIELLDQVRISNALLNKLVGVFLAAEKADKEEK